MFAGVPLIVGCDDDQERMLRHRDKGLCAIWVTLNQIERRKAVRAVRR